MAGSLFATAGTSSAATGWDAVARCESGGNPSINTGNGYYGLYQFDRRTWRGLGYSGTANQHSARVQTQAAEKLYAQRGASPWPMCGRYLRGSANVSSGSTHASRSSSRTSIRNISKSSRVVLGVWMASERRADVRAIQARLDRLGYHLAVDGQYGPQTRSVVLRFQRRARIAADGVYGPQTKAALFG